MGITDKKIELYKLFSDWSCANLGHPVKSQ